MEKGGREGRAVQKMCGQHCTHCIPSLTSSPPIALARVERMYETCTRCVGDLTASPLFKHISSISSCSPSGNCVV